MPHGKHLVRICCSAIADIQSTFDIQSTLVISTSLISNNRLSRSEKLVPVLTWKTNNR